MSKPAQSEKPQTQTPAAKAPPKGAKGQPAAGPDSCNAQGCKSSAARFEFCDEHFEQFKFGLIKKTGEPVSDYEKKFGHYQAYKAKRGAQKAA